MPNANKNEISMTQILVPMCLMALTLTLLFAFQMTQIMRDRDALEGTIIQQEQPLANAQKVHSQFASLIMTTRKFADEGSDGAKVLVGQLMQLGVIPASMQPQSQVVPPVPMVPEQPTAHVKP